MRLSELSDIDFTWKNKDAHLEVTFMGHGPSGMPYGLVLEMEPTHSAEDTLRYVKACLGADIAGYEEGSAA